MAKQQYEGKDNYGKPKSDYLSKIADMDEEALEKEVEQMCWLSAFANNNSRSDYHWMVDALYDECQNRNKPEIYSAGYEKARASCGG